MTVVMESGRVLSHDELVGLVAGDVEMPKTTLWSRLREKMAPVVHGINSAKLAAGHKIVEAYRSVTTGVASWVDRHPLVRDAVQIGMAFCISFTVTLFVLTGVLVLYILTLNWLDGVLS